MAITNGKRRGRGEGSIWFREDKQLYAASLIVGINPKTGKPRRKTVYAKSKEEILDKLHALRNERDEPQLPLSQSNLQADMEWWLDCTVKAKVDPSTLALYRQRAADYIYPNLGKAPTAALTTKNIEEFLQELGHRSADLRRKVGELLRRFFKYAVKRKMVADNITTEVALPKVTEEQIHPLDEHQVRRFLASAKKGKLYDLYVLALDSGARQGELLVLEWPDVDFENGILSITKTVQLHNGRHRVKEVKTKAARRRLRLAPYTLELLKQRKVKSKSHLVFANRNGKYIQRENIRRHTARVLERAGLPPIRFHDLRHTFATLALLKTKNVKAVSARLGHEDIRVTLNTYSHYLPVMEEELVGAMNQILTPAPAV